MSEVPMYSVLLSVLFLHARCSDPPSYLDIEREGEFFVDNLLVRIHLKIEMILVDRLCAMGVWILFPGSLISTFLGAGFRVYSLPLNLLFLHSRCSDPPSYPLPCCREGSVEGRRGGYIWGPSLTKWRTLATHLLTCGTTGVTRN